MPHMPPIRSGDIILADVLPPPRNEPSGPVSGGQASAEPIGLVWLILIAIAVFALVYLGLRRLSKARK